MIRLISDTSSNENHAPDLGEVVRKVFEPDGILQKTLDFEFRGEQAEMAKRVEDCLAQGEHLLFEAGTGVGKSLAYLVPAILHARMRKRPCVVATNTISLQEQLLEKDIPALRKILAGIPGFEEWADFECALLVGRANYLCANRLHRARSGQTELFEAGQREELERIFEWINENPVEGIRQEMSPLPKAGVWDLVNADSSLCSSKRCSPQSCCYRKARARVESADLVVVNHSLLFSLMGAGYGPSDEEGGVMFADDFVIFDEAHEIPEVAGDHLGLSMSSWAMETSLRRLYNPRQGKGLLKKLGRPKDLEAVEDASLAVDDFFQHLHVRILGEQSRIRLLEKGVFPMEVLPPLSRVVRSLVELSELSEDENRKLELKDQAKRMQGYLMGLSEVSELKDEGSVYWLERAGKKNQIIHLRSAPLDIASVLRRDLFGKQTSIIMTSATLTRKGKADCFKSQVGAEEVKEGIVHSPFDYLSNMQVRILMDSPEPMSGNRDPYLNYLVEAIHGSASAMEGGTLALFTNYSDLKYAYHYLLPRWQKIGRSVYAQGEGFSRSELRAKLIEEEDALLLGAESFWKGFDAKGPCLSQVIITRLPFENPSHPVMEAKTEILAEAGKSSFIELTLPSAVIRFRQGVGRLIRSQADVGDLLIMDSRILKKNYGSQFLSELPNPNYESLSLSELLGE